MATPAVRQLARTYGIKLEDILGSGEDGRILNDDVMKYAENKEGLNEELEVISKILPKPEVPGDEYSHLTVQKEVHRDPQPIKNDYGDKEINVRYALVSLNERMFKSKYLSVRLRAILLQGLPACYGEDNDCSCCNPTFLSCRGTESECPCQAEKQS